MKNIIYPSIRLRSVNVHKLKDTSCDRYYFWRWVLNLVPKGFNINFWFGSVSHKGFEVIGEGGTYKKAIKAMTKESNEFKEKSPPSSNMFEEITIQTIVWRNMIKEYRSIAKEKLKGLVLGGSEERFSIPLKYSPVMFNGRLDAWYKKGTKIYLFEAKTSSKITPDYFKRLEMDKQVNGYALALKHKKNRYPRSCYYTVFRKPQIRQKKTETISDFEKRLIQDLHERRYWYFEFYEHKFGVNSVEAVRNDIEGIAFDLYAKFEYLRTEDIIEPSNWARNEDQCFRYGTCPYFILCKSNVKWKTYLKFFVQRDIRYKEEKDELHKKPLGELL